MSEALPEPSVVELLETRRLRLVEAAAPRIPPEEQAAMNRAWDEAVRANQALFDGPAVSCAGLERDDPDGLVITWARTTYRLHALRRVPGATVWLPSLFVSVVQPSDDGRLLVVRMSPWTAAPGRWRGAQTGASSGSGDEARRTPDRHQAASGSAPLRM